MSDNFKQVVNLQAKTSEKPARAKASPKRKPAVRKQGNKQSRHSTGPAKLESRVEEIDQIYNDTESTLETKEELLQIDRPKARNNQSNFFKQLSLVFFLIIIVLLSLYFFTNKKQFNLANNETANQAASKGGWYSLQLTNNEVYYGFIKDTGADPVVLEKVYYNYNQISGKEPVKDEDKEPSNIRLVKRGKESHGPDGTMNIVRSQVMYMEILGEESKILKAILDYEE